MARARGANALLNTVFETTVGTIPGSGWFTAPFVSSTIGEERNLIASDLLGLGREPLDPSLDVANNVGDLVVPVDIRNFGRWLKLFFGNPVTSASGDDYSHVFTSGAVNLPSMSMEFGHPEIPTYAKHYGAKGNTLRIQMQRSGLLNATLGLIAIGESDPAATSAAGTPTSLVTQRFPQGSGSIKRDGTQLGGVVAAEFTYSNGLDPVETIKADGRIEDSDAGAATLTGQITVRFADTSLLTAAVSNTPIELDLDWAFAADRTLNFNVPRVFLPRAKRTIEGPGGIQATFNFQASVTQVSDALVVATLLNDVASY